jgi:hypothetical protein
MTWPVYPHNPYADAPETNLKYAVGALSVPVVLKSQPDRHVRANEKEMVFTLTVP